MTTGRWLSRYFCYQTPPPRNPAVKKRGGLAGQAPPQGGAQDPALLHGHTETWVSSGCFFRTLDTFRPKNDVLGPKVQLLGGVQKSAKFMLGACGVWYRTTTMLRGPKDHINIRI